MRNWSHKSVIKLIEETNSNDPEKIIREKAQNLVLKALEKGWNGPPFDALELSKYLDINVTPNDSVFDARIQADDRNNVSIEFNPFQKPTRINFSVAHEIIHTFFSDWKDEVRNRELHPDLNRELEQLCNIGAAEIQLPYGVFSNDANSIKDITLERLIELATKYRSSLESLFIRFVEVINRPCAIMICSFQTEAKLVIEYVKTSSSFKEKIPKNFVIPKGSKAYECTSPGWTSRETVNWKLLDSKYNIFCIGISPLRKDNRPRVGIIIVPHHQSGLLQNNKINIEFGDATKPRGNDHKIIAQIVNTSGGLGFGFGKSLSKNYPFIKKMLANWKANKQEFILGNIQLINAEKDVFICQLLAQEGLFGKKGEIPLKYISLRECLVKLYDKAVELNASIHMPLIGAGQAKGDWNIIQGMIFDELVSKEIKVNIYLIPGHTPNINLNSHISFFNESSTWHKEK